MTMSSGRKRVVSSCMPCYTRKQKVYYLNYHEPEAFPLDLLESYADSIYDSATMNILVIIVLDDNALKSVSIILLRVPQATHLVLRVFPSPVEIKYKRTKQED